MSPSQTHLDRMHEETLTHLNWSGLHVTGASKHMQQKTPLRAVCIIITDDSFRRRSFWRIKSACYAEYQLFNYSASTIISSDSTIQLNQIKMQKRSLCINCINRALQLLMAPNLRNWKFSDYMLHDETKTFMQCSSYTVWKHETRLIVIPHSHPFIWIRPLTGWLLIKISSRPSLHVWLHDNHGRHLTEYLANKDSSAYWFSSPKSPD